MLEENGVLEDLMDKPRYKKNFYDEDAHKDTDYALYVKHYSPFKT